MSGAPRVQLMLVVQRVPYELHTPFRSVTAPGRLLTLTVENEGEEAIFVVSVVTSVSYDISHEELAIGFVLPPPELEVTFHPRTQAVKPGNRLNLKASVPLTILEFDDATFGHHALDTEHAKRLTCSIDVGPVPLRSDDPGSRNRSTTLSASTDLSESNAGLSKGRARRKGGTNGIGR